tara:strand:- start:669 stop:1016 length:348 start_codon:yes stop_codon:yes gene_type:complete
MPTRQTKTYLVDNETLEGLKMLDNWLSKQPWKHHVDTETAMMARELITRVETKGFYSKEERDVLNGIRNYWFESKYQGQWICRYCLKSTKDVDYDYLVGQDHLECSLKEEMDEKN